MKKRCGKLESRIDTIDRVYSVIIFVSLVLQFGSVIYQIYSDTILSTFISAMELLIWGVAWIFYCSRKHILNKQIMIILPCLILTLILIIKLVSANNYSRDYFSPINSLYQMYSIVYSLSVGYSALYLPKRLRSQILKYFYILISVTVIPSYFYVLRDSDAIRNGAKLYGIIDFQYIYAILPFLAITSIALFHCRVQRRLKIWMIIAVVLNIGIIVLSNFATATILAIIAVVLGLIVGKKFNVIKMTLCIVVCAMIIYILRYQIANLLLALAESNLFGTVMKHRIQDIAKILSGGGVGWSFLARIRLMEYSWQSFLKGPIFGVPFNGLGYGGLGYHETWITLLAYGGIVGFLAVVVSFILFFKRLIRKSKSKYFVNAYFASLFIILILSVLNPIFSKSIMMIPCLVMPLLHDIFMCASLKNKKRLFTSRRSPRKRKYVVPA